MRKRSIYNSIGRVWLLTTMSSVRSWLDASLYFFFSIAQIFLELLNLSNTRQRLCEGVGVKGREDVSVDAAIFDGQSG